MVSDISILIFNLLVLYFATALKLGLVAPTLFSNYDLTVVGTVVPSKFFHLKLKNNSHRETCNRHYNR